MNVTYYQKENKPSEDVLHNRAVDMCLQRSYIDVLYALSHFNLSNYHNGVVQGNNKGKFIKGPCLLIHGSKDKNVAPSESWELLKMIGKTCDIEIVKGGTHFIFDEK